MKNYSIKRPVLPNTTPFSSDNPSTSSILSTPWHSRHISSLVNIKEGEENSQYASTSVTRKSARSKRSVRLASYHQWDREEKNTSMSGSSLLDSDNGNGNGSTNGSSDGRYPYDPSSSILTKSSFPFLSNTNANTANNNSTTSFFTGYDSTATAAVLRGIDSTTELEALKAELSKKTLQAELIYSTTQLAQARIKTVMQGLSVLHTACVEKDRASASRQRSVDKLVSINMILIDTLDALELQPKSNDDNEGLSKLMLRIRSDLLPSINYGENLEEHLKLGKNDIHSVNSKLKECLLIMSREYFSSKKSIKSIMKVYEELRSALRTMEQKNR